MITFIPHDNIYHLSFLWKQGRFKEHYMLCSAVQQFDISGLEKTQIQGSPRQDITTHFINLL